jgi:hypothetical protein
MRFAANASPAFGTAFPPQVARAPSPGLHAPTKMTESIPALCLLGDPVEPSTRGVRRTGRAARHHERGQKRRPVAQDQTADTFAVVEATKVARQRPRGERGEFVDIGTARYMTHGL